MNANQSSCVKKIGARAAPGGTSQNANLSTAPKIAAPGFPATATAYAGFSAYSWQVSQVAVTMRLVADWRQIQARIRKARNSADPPAQLAALYERTRDAMVAFELAQIHEKSGSHAEAARWYTAAAERFRRAQWKQKAEEALARLGAQLPVAAAAVETAEPAESPAPIIAEFADEQAPELETGPNGGQQESVFEQPEQPAAPQPAGEARPAHRRRRRGRRGGRGRHKGKRAGAAGPQQQALPGAGQAEESAGGLPEAEDRTRSAHEPEPVSSFEPAASAPIVQLRGRHGDPALSSRMAKLEAQLRRMLACAPSAVNEPGEAPAGPGVFLVTDADQTSYYYVEACQTLRVGIGNLLRGGRGSREGVNLKEKLADHLGISESSVSKYLKEHCIVRWLQLDEGASFLAHFAIAVLRPVANE